MTTPRVAVWNICTVALTRFPCGWLTDQKALLVVAPPFKVQGPGPKSDEASKRHVTPSELISMVMRATSPDVGQSDVLVNVSSYPAGLNVVTGVVNGP